jgi:hypothetical protein
MEFSSANRGLGTAALTGRPQRSPCWGRFFGRMASKTEYGIGGLRTYIQARVGSSPARLPRAAPIHPRSGAVSFGQRKARRLGRVSRVFTRWGDESLPGLFSTGVIRPQWPNLNSQLKLIYVGHQTDMVISFLLACPHHSRMGQSNENAIEHGAFSFAESGGQYFSTRSKIAFRAAPKRPSATSVRIAEAA